MGILQIQENFGKLHFECRMCGEYGLPMSSLAKGTYAFKTGKGYCKPCRSLKISIAEIEKKAKKNPQDYFTCNNCDRTQSVFKRGFHKENPNRELIQKCGFCESTDLEDYIGG